VTHEEFGRAFRDALNLHALKERVPGGVAKRLLPLANGPDLVSGTLWWYQSTRQDNAVIQ
jgi:hypothetical protein